MRTVLQGQGPCEPLSPQGTPRGRRALGSGAPRLPWTAARSLVCAEMQGAVHSPGSASTPHPALTCPLNTAPPGCVWWTRGTSESAAAGRGRALPLSGLQALRLPAIHQRGGRGSAAEGHLEPLCTRRAGTRGGLGPWHGCRERPLVWSLSWLWHVRAGYQLAGGD